MPPLESFQLEFNLPVASRSEFFPLLFILFYCRCSFLQLSCFFLLCDWYAFFERVTTVGHVRILKVPVCARGKDLKLSQEFPKCIWSMKIILLTCSRDGQRYFFACFVFNDWQCNVFFYCMGKNLTAGSLNYSRCVTSCFIFVFSFRSSIRKHSVYNFTMLPIWKHKTNESKFKTTPKTNEPFRPDGIESFAHYFLFANV